MRRTCPVVASRTAPAPARAEQYALAFTDLLDSLRQRQVDVIAQAEGADAAIALVKLRPGSLVRRLVFSGASPTAVVAARELGLEFCEVALASGADEAISPLAIETQLSEIVGFFSKGSAQVPGRHPSVTDAGPDC